MMKTSSEKIIKWDDIGPLNTYSEEYKPVSKRKRLSRVREALYHFLSQIVKFVVGFVVAVVVCGVSNVIRILVVMLAMLYGFVKITYILYLFVSSWSIPNVREQMNYNYHLPLVIIIVYAAICFLGPIAMQRFPAVDSPYLRRIIPWVYRIGNIYGIFRTFPYFVSMITSHKVEETVCGKVDLWGVGEGNDLGFVG
jgi:hypothetical protein